MLQKYILKYLYKVQSSLIFMLSNKQLTLIFKLTKKITNMNTEISTYVLEVMEENHKLHFIAFTEDKILAISPKSKKAHFFYYVNEDVSFHFNMLCEVRSIDQQWFEDIISDLNYRLESKETDTDYYEIIANWQPA